MEVLADDPTKDAQPTATQSARPQKAA